MNKYKNRLDEILDDTFELKCRMLFLVANLKNNKNTIYKVSISNYLDKIYNIIEYIYNINIKCEEDMLFCNILLKLYLCYLKVLYNKLLDMFDLQTKRLFDNYESIKTSNKMKKEKYLNKYYIELLSDYNYNIIIIQRQQSTRTKRRCTRIYSGCIVFFILLRDWRCRTWRKCRTRSRQ